MQHGRRKCWRERWAQSITAVGAADELGLLGQECRESLLVTSQMEEETDVISDQLCWGSNDFGAFIPLKTTQTQKHCQEQRAHQELAGPQHCSFFKSLEQQRLPPVKLNELLEPKAENELAEWKFGLQAVSMGLHNPEL